MITLHEAIHATVYFILCLSKNTRIHHLNYNNTHRDIVEACKNGDRQAQFNLYRLYSKAMYNICIRMLNNELDAEDILQNSFVDIFTKLDSFKYQSSIGAWIKRIVVNNCINFLKKRKLNFQSIEDNVLERTVIPAEDNDKFTVVDIDISKVNTAILKLPDGYRIVFSLYLLEGYDHSEIADILNVSVATSKSQYSRAKRKLRAILEDSKELPYGR